MDTSSSAVMPFEVFFITMILMLIMSYFMFVYPQKKRALKHKKFIQSLQVNDKVLTYGGMFGVILSINEDKIVVITAEKTKIELSSRYVIQKLS